MHPVRLAIDPGRKGLIEPPLNGPTFKHLVRVRFLHPSQPCDINSYIPEALIKSKVPNVENGKEPPFAEPFIPST
jgi:hypothetical protein